MNCFTSNAKGSLTGENEIPIFYIILCIKITYIFLFPFSTFDIAYGPYPTSVIPFVSDATGC